MGYLLERSKKICEENDILPQRKHGQNFLIEESIYKKIIEVAELNKNDVVLEIGPGLGFLTEQLAKEAKKVVAVEIDETLCRILPARFEGLGLKNIELLNQDILRLDVDIAYNKIVANLPYNISAHFLYQFLSKREAPELMVLMLQKEVVERICAGPGKMSVLAVSVQYYADPSLVEIVPKQAFWPEPKIDSAIVRIAAKKNQGERDEIYEKKFFQLVKFGFSSRRKMLKNNLAGCYHITQVEAEERILQAKIAKSARAQELSLADWKCLLGEFL